MENFIFDRDAYLQRIHFTKEVNGSIDCLRDLHHAHFYTFPFENFDICLGRAIELEPELLFRKLVLKQRGGYCFELNGLFLMAVQSLGFDARALLARVHVDGTPSGRGHQLSLVTIQGRQWIVDVGFGRDAPQAPVPLVFNHPVTNNGQTVRLMESRRYGAMLQVRRVAGWEDLYSFDLEYVCPADIKYGNHYTSTSPDSFFVQSRVAALAVENGFITLFNNTIKKTLGDKETTIQLEEGPKYIESLEIHFGIRLDAAYDELKPCAVSAGSRSF